MQPKVEETPPSPVTDRLAGEPGFGELKAFVGARAVISIVQRQLWL